jgi:hypothetical protein
MPMTVLFPHQVEERSNVSEVPSQRPQFLESYIEDFDMQYFSSVFGHDMMC